jgi:hypothetical protein
VLECENITIDDSGEKADLMVNKKDGSIIRG